MNDPRASRASQQGQGCAEGGSDEKSLLCGRFFQVRDHAPLRLRKSGKGEIHERSRQQSSNQYRANAMLRCNKMLRRNKTSLKCPLLKEQELAMMFSGLIAQIKDRRAKRAEFNRIVSEINS